VPVVLQRQRSCWGVNIKLGLFTPKHFPCGGCGDYSGKENFHGRQSSLSGQSLSKAVKDKGCHQPGELRRMKQEKTTKAEDTHISTNLIKFCTDQPSVKLTCHYLILFYDEKLQSAAVVPSLCVFKPAVILKSCEILLRFFFTPPLISCRGVELEGAAKGVPCTRGLSLAGGCRRWQWAVAELPCSAGSGG